MVRIPFPSGESLSQPVFRLVQLGQNASARLERARRSQIAIQYADLRGLMNGFQLEDPELLVLRDAHHFRRENNLRARAEFC